MASKILTSSNPTVRRSLAQISPANIRVLYCHQASFTFSRTTYVRVKTHEMNALLAPWRHVSQDSTLHCNYIFRIRHHPMFVRSWCLLSECPLKQGRHCWSQSIESDAKMQRVSTISLNVPTVCCSFDTVSSVTQQAPQSLAISNLIVTSQRDHDATEH